MTLPTGRLLKSANGNGVALICPGCITSGTHTGSVQCRK